MTRAPAAPVRLVFLLVPQFSLMAFSAAIEPLRAANRLSGRARYEWRLASLDGAPVPASNGIPIGVHASLDDIAKPDLLVVCAGLEPLQYAGNRRLNHVLRRLARHGSRVGAISGGTFILAEAGLLAGRRCTVHWEYAQLFAERYPRLDLRPDLYVVDRDVFTCSGGTAALDMMLHFVREQLGAALALAVAEQFLHPRIRDHGDHQRMDAHARYGLHDARLAEIVRRMEAALEEPLDPRRLAADGGLSTRQVERLFRQHLGASPRAFHRRLRLEHGRMLLQQTSQPVRAVALQCGFGSTAHFCRAYKHAYARTPGTERAAAPAPRRALRGRRS